MDPVTIFRVDKFVVPEASRGEFLSRIRDTHALLRQQPGFVRDAILEQASGPGRFNIVTIAGSRRTSETTAGSEPKRPPLCTQGENVKVRRIVANAEGSDVTKVQSFYATFSASTAFRAGSRAPNGGCSRDRRPSR